MSYFTNNNYIDNGFWMGYRWVQPKNWYNNLNLNFNIHYSRRLNPGDFQNFGINANINGQLKNLWKVGINLYGNPQSNDFYEARKENYLFKRPGNVGMGVWFNTNDAKKYSANFSIYTAVRPTVKGFGYTTTLNNQFRFNNNFTLSIRNSVDITNNGMGFAYFDNSINEPIVGLRQRVTIENTLSAKYNFTNKMGLIFRVRHYWSKVRHENYQQLHQDGSLTNITNNGNEGNYNFNTLNVDMTYTWQFALGSFITFNWKDFSSYSETQPNYFDNLSKTLAAPQSNNFSLKIIYFLDYLSFKKQK